MTTIGVSRVRTVEPGAAGNGTKAPQAPAPAANPAATAVEATAMGGEPERSDSDDSMDPEN